MPRPGRMKLSLDVSEYIRLSPDVRVRFDGWLEAETLLDKRIVKLTLAEGEVIVERHSTDENGRARLTDDGESVLIEVARYPVKTLPPMEAFDA